MINFQMENPEGSVVRWFQKWFKVCTGVSMPLLYGRRLYQVKLLSNSSSLMVSDAKVSDELRFVTAATADQHSVWSSVDITLVTDPTDDEVNRVHQQYCRPLRELFDKNKICFGVPKEAELVIK